MKIVLEKKNDIRTLREAKVKTELYISGRIFSARDAAHKKLKELYDKKALPPISFNDALIYYMGPTPAKEGNPVGSAGPTSSYRMDEYFELTCMLGIAGTIGKGERDSLVKEKIIKYKAPYLITIGGAGAYLAKCIISAKTVLFPELGAESVMELEVKNFPLIVGIDIYGESIFKR